MLRDGCAWRHLRRGGTTFTSWIAEIVRAGINSLPKGQTEAASAIGLRKGQTMRLILLPQAVTVMLPAIVCLVGDRVWWPTRRPRPLGVRVVEQEARYELV